MENDNQEKKRQIHKKKRPQHKDKNSAKSKKNLLTNMAWKNTCKQIP